MATAATSFPVVPGINNSSAWCTPSPNRGLFHVLRGVTSPLPRLQYHIRLGHARAIYAWYHSTYALYNDLCSEVLIDIHDIAPIATMTFLSAVVTIQLIKAQVVSGLPLARAASFMAPTTGWVADPSGRGTLSIITSCVLTMGLCVWSALHLNIPSWKETTVQMWLRNIKWMLMGLFGPELVVFGAWRQYASARTLQNRILALEGSPPVSLFFSSTSPSADFDQKSIITDEVVFSQDQSKWSTVHSFYASMGGFVFDLDATFASILQTSTSQPQRLTLTPRGIALLADCGLLPDISKKEIDDKSKADGIAKILVCLQAGWMVLQVVARIVYGLPVTLLEVNTIGHVICAFSIYLLWWHKPRLVREPTVLRGEWVKPVCAFMWMSSRMSDPGRKKRIAFLHPRRVAELTNLSFHPDFVPQEEGRELEALTDGMSVTEHKQNMPLPSSTFVYRQNFGYLGPVNEIHSEKNVPAAVDKPSTGSLSASECTPTRWCLALDAMQTFPNLARFSQANPGEPQKQWRQFCPEEFLCERAGNWPSDALLNEFRGLLMGMALWFATIAFGGVHAAAWNEYFPSKVESWLWRSSSIYIMASGLLWLCINFLGQVSKPFDAYWEEILAHHAGFWSYTIIGSLCTVCGLAYGFARMFLVVEAVISLRSLPIMAYQTPEWSQLIPHL